MVAGHLALEGGYDTRTLVSLGSPIEADVGTGDAQRLAAPHGRPVAMLDGRRARRAGGRTRQLRRAADRRPALRAARPRGCPRTVSTQYTQTARLLDASADPRMDAVRELFDRARRRGIRRGHRVRASASDGRSCDPAAAAVRSVLRLRAQDDAEHPVDERDDDRRDQRPTRSPRRADPSSRSS